ncbi:MAG: DUF285 domain-containing protein [Ekhidna sp.]|nr:DUF285 domain-containing protein [Ekhidna sp.]
MHTDATPPSHTYATANTYTVAISGTFPHIQFGSVNILAGGVVTVSTAAGQIRTVEQWGDIEWASMNNAFTGCNNLTTADDAGVPDLSNVTDMSFMFANSSFSGDISTWDVSSVTNMTGMFSNSTFNGDLSKWDVSKVTSMPYMFQNSSFNGNISDWNVSKVTSMSFMFVSSSFSGDLSKWDISSVRIMNSIFSGSTFNGDLSNWNVSNVTDISFMFARSSFNGDLSNWDISNVTNMERMFTSNTSMSSENYDKLLIGWSTKTPEETRIPQNITFGAPDKYSCRGKAGRDILTGEPYNWTIAGDELIPIRTEAAALPEVTSQCIASLTPPTAKSSCTIGEGTTVTAAHDVSTFPITESTLHRRHRSPESYRHPEHHYRSMFAGGSRPDLPQSR